MKAKPGLIVASIVCATIVGASFRTIPESATHGSDQFWKSQGIDPKMGEKTEHLVRQFSADVRHQRPVKDADWQVILSTIKSDKKLAPAIFWNAVTLIGTKYQKPLADVAAETATSKNETEAYPALAMLRAFKDPRWRPLALGHQADKGELFQCAVNEAMSDASR